MKNFNWKNVYQGEFENWDSVRKEFGIDMPEPEVVILAAYEVDYAGDSVVCYFDGHRQIRKRAEEIIRELKQQKEKTTTTFHHKLVVNNLNHINRAQFFAETIGDQSCLHVGCADAGAFHPENNLHLRLEKIMPHLCGQDASLAGIEALKKHSIAPEKINTAYFCKDFEWVLLPEVLEHVEAPIDFLRMIKSKKLLITVPCAYQCQQFFKQDGETFSETVNSDHKCWYSPYTLYKTLDTAGWKVNKMFFINGISVGAICKKQ